MPKFSAKLMEHFAAPRHQGRLATPDRTGMAGVPHQGPFLLLDLHLHDDVITDAAFQAHGCGPAIACGSVLTELIIGRSAAEARSLTAQDLADALDGLPDDKRHCADAAITALKNALAE